MLHLKPLCHFTIHVWIQPLYPYRRRAKVRIHTCEGANTYFKMKFSKIFSSIRACEYRPKCIRAKINSPRLFSWLYWFCAGGVILEQLRGVSGMVRCNSRCECHGRAQERGSREAQALYTQNIYCTRAINSKTPFTSRITTTPQQLTLWHKIITKIIRMRLFCLQLEASCLQWSFFYLQLTILAFMLTIRASLLTVLAFLLAVGALLLTVGKCV